MSLDRYRNEALALAARPDVTFRVQIHHADAETFGQAQAWNEQVDGMTGVAVRNDAGELLFINHQDYGGWVFPGGRVERGESVRAAAVREVREESGVESRLVGPMRVDHLVTRHDGHSTDTQFVLFEGEAIDPEPADNPGLADETITDVQWVSAVPDDLPDDRFVRETIAFVAAQFETVETVEPLDCASLRLSHE